MWPAPHPTIDRWRAVVVSATIFTLLSLSPVSALPADTPPAVESLSVDPTAVVLHGGNRQQQLLVTGRTADGRLIDVTDRCVFTSSDPAVVSLAGGVARAAGDGTAEVRVRLGSASAVVQVRVAGATTAPPVHFATDVVPLFSKYGCNGGGCHGKASGQNGFKLSVFGFDPAADYDALVKEARGRRVFAAAPDASLLVQKATGRTAHGGGRRIAPGSPDHALLLAWLRQGMPVGAADAPRAVGSAPGPVPARPRSRSNTRAWSRWPGSRCRARTPRTRSPRSRPTTRSTR